MKKLNIAQRVAAASAAVLMGAACLAGAPTNAYADAVTLNGISFETTEYHYTEDHAVPAQVTQVTQADLKDGTLTYKVRLTFVDGDLHFSRVCQPHTISGLVNSCAAGIDTTVQVKNWQDPADWIDLHVTMAPKAHGNLTHHDAVAATCTDAGCAEYWQCDDCGAVFADESATTATTLDELAIAPTGHKYENGVCTVCGAEDPNYDPTKPADPSKPTEDPAKPATDPAKPTADPAKPAADAKKVKKTVKATLPQTGDASVAALPVLAAGFAVLALGIRTRKSE